MADLLIADDEERLRINLSGYFRLRGFSTREAATGQETLSLVEDSPPDALVLDLRLPDVDGLEVLTKVKQIAPATGVVILTGHGDVETAVKAMKLKADHFLLKPVDLKALEVIVSGLVASARAIERASYLERKAFGGSAKRDGTLGLPPDIESTLLQFAEQGSATILLTGETGTGKGVAARFVHDHSLRASKPFVEINCAGLSPVFLESELFGHERGAFTDAKQFKHGLLEMAEGGTLFMDEIGTLTPDVQAKLLKVLEDKSFRRLGGVRPMRADVRFIAATNEHLEKAARKGRFRQDLYYRINILSLALPPLRQDRGRIEVLAHVFLAEFRASAGKPTPKLSKEALALLQSYSWPGNIRELRNICERMALLVKGDLIGSDELPKEIAERKIPKPAPVGDLSLMAHEREHILAVLDMCHGNRTRASRLLGIHRTTLIEKIQKYGM